MRTRSKPVHRRILVPWYDNDGACILCLCLLVPTGLFGLIGIWVAGTRVEWHGLMWFPALLTLASGLVSGRILMRWVRRRRQS